MKIFDAAVSLIDVFEPTNNNDDFDWSFTDVSDEVQYFFSVALRSSNLTPQNVTITLRNKFTGEEVSRINLSEKNILKFTDSCTELRKIDNLNRKYELIWSLNDTNRIGIVYFDYPIRLDVNLQASVCGRP